jgi:hypothetical protein
MRMRGKSKQAAAGAGAAAVAESDNEPAGTVAPLEGPASSSRVNCEQDTTYTSEVTGYAAEVKICEAI